MSTARERLYADFEDQDRYDYDPLTDLGPIQVAIMGEGRMTLYGEGEAIELAMERPPLEDLGTPKELKGERAINHGSADARLLGEGERQEEPDLCDGETCSKQCCNRVSPGSLQPDYTISKGGGGGGGGRRKNPPPFKAKELQDDSGEAIGTTRCTIPGLTAGERDYYARHGSGVARGVLQRYVEELTRRHEPQETQTSRLRIKVRARDLAVYGLAEWQIQVLRARPGSAARVLGEYARERDQARVEREDRAEAERVQSRRDARTAA